MEPHIRSQRQASGGGSVQNPTNNNRLISDVLATINFWIGTTAIGLFDEISDMMNYFKPKQTQSNVKLKDCW